jgi:serine/threonine protein kinase
MNPVEAERNNITYTHNCDTWSLGIISYYLVMGEYPFKEKRVLKTGGVYGLKLDI